MKGKIAKVLTFLVVIGLVTSMAMINNILPIKVAKNVQNIEQQEPAGEMNVIENITNWDTRVLSYSTHYGKVGENVWEFHDTYGTYKNLYCVQSGSNLKKATYYSVYDLYNIDENTINTYFESEEAYHHFLYILENMYLVGRTGPDKTYMENSILSKIGHTEDYNEMKDEINTLNKEMGVRVGETDNAQFALYVGNDPSSTYITLDGRDNFLQVVQRYVLMHYVKQKDGKVGPDPINFNDWSSFIWTGYGYKKYVSSEYNNEKFDSAKNFANALIKMLERDFDDSTYDINKYKGFDRNDTYVTTDNATYDEPSNKIGPFTVVNPKGFEISVSKLKYGNTDIGYTIVDEDGNDVDLSGKTTEKTFYIKLNEQLDGSDSLSAQFHIDFGDIPTARIFIPKYENGTIKKDSQAMVNNEKRHDEKDVSWQTKVDTMKPDIALKKYIYAVNGSTDTVQPRLDSIDLTPLANETSTNAIYNMNKTPLKVRAGDTVTYAIQLFNEGEINGTAAEITDYLPGNMTFIRAYTDFNAANAPGYDGSSNINNCGTNNSIKLRNPNDYMTPYSTDDTEETFRAKSQIIYVDCKVGLSNKNYIYTNMAEITEYKMERGSDIDSDPSNWKQPSSDRKSSAWQNYSNNHSDENPTWFDNGFHNWGAQDNNGTGDDDDFDKVIIDNIDIALTKRIEGKLEEDGTETYLTPEGSIENVGKSYINITGFDEVKNGTADDLKYEMNKKVALVQREDKLVVAITVYNEGHLDGIVKQITDYLPQGLVFNPEKTAELYGVEPTYNESSLVVASGDNTITYTYDSRSRYLTMRLNTYRGIELKNLNEYDNDLNNHKVDQFEIKFIVDVSKSANGKLYNSAAITEYGYYGADGKYYSAWPAGVDKDSNAYVSDVQNLKFEHEEKHNSFENMSNDMTKIHKNNIQNQDDDDMDVVEVVYNPSFDLSLRKYIYQVEKDFDSSYENVNGDSSQGYRKFWENYNQRIPELDDESIDALKENGTAEYYHDKIKVKVETGNLVIYRMRVYNEGKNDDYYGRATEITDYLPEGLEFVALEDSSNHFGNKDEAYDSGWSADVEGNKIILTYSGEDATKILPVDSIETIVKIEKAKDIEYKLSQSQALTDEETEFYDTEYESYVNLNEKDYYQEVGVICRVTATPTDGEDAKIITNRAAITKHEAYEKIYSDESNRYDLELKQNVEDRDSQPDELTNPSLDYWYFNNVIDESTPLVYYPGEQDDDDFDTIYVNSYKLKIVKTDGKNNLPGVDLKVLKYRSISYPEQNFEAEELSDMETAIKDSGEGEKFFSAPANILENDVYIVKEIQSVNGYYNPFAGKYIKFSFRGDPTGSVEVNYQVVDYAPLMIEIYEDNGDDDYTNDNKIQYNHRDPDSIYDYVAIGAGNNSFTITIKNKKIEQEGKYTVKLAKYGKKSDGNVEQIGGVQFSALGKFNGESSVAIPHTGAIIESIADKYVDIIPDSYTDGYININPNTYETPDEIIINETGIRADAVDSEGHPINEKYYTGLLDKELKISINKTLAADVGKELYYVDSLDLSIDGESFTGRKTLDNGSEIDVNLVKRTPIPDSHGGTLGPTEAVIQVVIINPYIEKGGDYNLNLVKYKEGSNTPVAGVHFTATGHVNGKDVSFGDSDELIETGTSAVKIEENLEIEEDSIKDPDTYTFTEKDVGSNDDMYVGINQPIKLTVNKTTDKTDPSNWVYKVDSVTMEIGNESVETNGDGKTITLENGAEATIKYNSTTKTIELIVSNPKKTHEGDYSINIKKMGTDGRQLGGVVFETSGHFNGEDVGIPSATSNEITSLPSGTVNLMPDSFNGKVTIAGDNYEEADKVTFKETRIDENAVDDQGNAVSGNYYLPIKDKVFELTINKDVKHEETKDIYYVSSLGLKVDGKTDNVTGSGFSYTYNDPNSEAKVTVTYNETNRTTSVVVENPPIEREGTYHVKLVKYKKGSDTPVAGVEFTATATIDGEQKPIASDEKPLRTETSPISVKDNVPMSEENIGVDDVYTLKEKSVGTNSDIYIGYEGDIGLTVKKRMDTSNPAKKVFLVDKVSLTINNQIVEGNSITLDNGTKISVSYNEATKTIEIRVEDPLKEGKFKLNLIKHKYNVDEDNDGENDPLAGATFDITINDGTSDIKKVTNQVTDDEGKIPEIGNINITADDLTYTITVKEVNPPEGYIGLGAPVTFTAKSKFDGEKYVLDTQAQPQIENEYIQAEVNDDEILIETENRVEPVIHKGVKTVENQDSGYDKNEIQTWVINTSVPKGIKDYTVYNVTDTVDPEKKNNAEKRIAFMGEDNPGKNVVVKYKGTETILTEGKEYQVSFDTTTKQLKVTFINVTEGTDNFDGGRALEEDTILEITYKTQFTLDDNGDPIGLNQRIPNKATLEYNGNGADENKTKESEEPEVHTGGLGVYKFDKESNNALEGAKFRLVRTKEEANSAVAAAQEVALHGDYTAFNAIDWVKKYNEDGSSGDAWEITTDKNGYAYFAGLEFGEDAEKEGASPKNEGVNGAPIYNYDWSTASTTYYLIEVEVPYEYILLEQVAAESEVKKDSFVVTDLTKYHKVGNELVVPEGEYGLEILKYGKYEGEESKAIEGVIFSAKRTVNGQEEENLGDLTATDATGRTLVGDVVTIDKDQVDIDDVYTIHEESIPEESEYYVGLEKDIKLTVSKQSVKSEDKKKFLNSVTGISMTIEGENVTEVEAGKKYIATVVKDGQTLQVIAELKEDENGGQLINLTVENPHKVGQFPLHLIKTIKGTNPAQPLEEAGFKISIKDGNEYVKTTNGISIDGTHEYFTDKAGNILIEDIDIRKPGLTYSVEIEESTVPDKYIGIAGKITYTVTSVVDGNKLSLQAENDVVVTNDVKVEVKDGEIWNYVENKPEPVIHKGVKRIRNQDAGYDGDEIQTWVVNSTIPAGIEDYVQYIIDDEIDFEKQNVAEKRIEYIDNSVEVSIIEDYEGEKVKDLVPETDYLVDFDDSTKKLKITFIDVDNNEEGFKEGRKLPVGKIIEVKYKTKFRLDENGLIIGLQQIIKNKAFLTYGVKDTIRDQKKQSEEPEVHTGAVGVLKYEDVNKNGEFDDEDKVLEGAHFKIVKTEEEAKKALKAVLEDDEKTLSTINFIKTRDEEGRLTDIDVELITGEDGRASYQGLEFGEDADGKGENPTPDGQEEFLIYRYKDEWKDLYTEYYLVETEAPYNYYLLDHTTKFIVSMDSYSEIDLTKFYKEQNKPKIYDLSLRKFITHVNGEDRDGNKIDRNITDREPRVTLTDEFKDKENDKVTTAVYEHTKEPVIVQQGNIVTYTIRIYNEGPEDAYAAVVKDDIPDGVEFIPYTEGDGSVNDEYRWKLVDENDKPVSDISKAKYIITDYLSMEQGEVKDGVNENLLKGYDSDTMDKLDYRDLKVQFLVIEPNTSERIITNYAQISYMTNEDGKGLKDGIKVIDRDSTPNEWIDGEDDQDVEHIRLLYFDLALRKWVTKAKVTQDGQETVYETGHKAEDDPEDVVKVDLKKSKIDKVVVKFEYQIRITNEGRIGGWCEEITDHIPDGLVFEQADNPIWTVVDDKTIVTDVLKDTYLEPGESAEVTVVLRWVNSGDNLGIKVNIAEISKDRNEYGVHDIDSTPGNYKWGEDDIDDAPVMLAVTTGNMIVGYTILGLVVISIIAVGVVAVKKVRNEEQYF